MPNTPLTIETAGQDAFIIYFAQQTSSEVSAQIQTATHHIRQQMAEIIIDLVPSYASLLVIYDLNRSDSFAIRHQLRQILTHLDATTIPEGNLMTLPVYYSEESGPDLAALARQADLKINDVIQIHQQSEYRVYAIGFAPGFAYLGEVDKRIAAPRLSTPRQKVPRGAVAIADRQTAVYPAASPGGWNLIGRCPTRMFTPDAQPSMPIQVGDRVRFKPIEREQFLQLGGEL